MIARSQTPKGKRRPPQHQRRRPGREHKMVPRPKVALPEYRGSGKLRDKVALISGGDSGIGRAAAVLFAREGADVCITYLNEHKDAKETQRLIEREGRRCLAIPGDIRSESHCRKAVEKTIKQFHRLDILVNNAAEQLPQEDIVKITS